MKKRQVVACMPGTNAARTIYYEVLRPLVSESHRLEITSYVEDPVPEEFSNTIRTWIYHSNAVFGVIDGQHNSNVLYEVGVTIGFGKPLILLSDNIGNVPDMLRARNVLIYDPTDLDLEALRCRASSALTAALNGTYVDQRFRDHVQTLLSTSSPAAKTIAVPIGSPEVGEEAQLGMEFYKIRRYPEAIIHLEAALKSGSRDHETSFFLADSYFMHAESLPPGERKRLAYQRMQLVAKDASRHNPGDRPLRKTVALASMKLGEFDIAESIFTDLFKEDPENGNPAYNLACLYALQKSRNNCIRHLSEAFMRNPEYRFLARLDPDFDALWKDELIQRLMFPATINRAV